MALVRGPNIVNDGIVYCWDVGNLMSYPGSGTTLADLVGTANLTVNGSPTLTSTGPWYFTFPLSQTTKYLIKKPLYNAYDRYHYGDVGKICRNG